MRQIFLYIFLIFSVSCGTQKQLKKSFIGESVSVLKEEFGSPKTVLDQGGEIVYIFEKTKELRSTEISQGKLTLDPIVTPMVQKTERFFFTVVDGKVIKVKLEEEYER